MVPPLSVPVAFHFLYTFISVLVSVIFCLFPPSEHSLLESWDLPPPHTTMSLQLRTIPDF